MLRMLDPRDSHHKVRSNFNLHEMQSRRVKAQAKAGVLMSLER